MTENEDITAATGDISAEAPQEPSPTAEPPPAAATADAVPAQTATDADGVAGTNPNKKRKVALFLSYVGHGYQGMQRNPGAKTIEEDLFGAIHRAGGISEANADERGYTKVGEIVVFLLFLSLLFFFGFCCSMCIKAQLAIVATNTDSLRLSVCAGALVPSSAHR